MNQAVVLLLAGLVVAVFVIGIRHSNDLFVVKVSQGKLRLARGRLPHRLMSDLGDVLRGSGADGTLRAVVENQRPRLLVTGNFSDGQAQQLKNVLGTYPLARIKTGSLKA